MKSEAHTQGSVTEEMPATADVSWSKWPSAFNVLTNLNASLELPLLSGSRGGRVSDTMSVFTKHRSGDAMTEQNQEVESSWEPPAPGLSSCPHVAVAEAVKWQNRIWEPRPECCYFWWRGTERNGEHCKLLMISVARSDLCPFAPERSPHVWNSSARSDVGDAVVIQSEKRCLLMWTFWTVHKHLRSDPVFSRLLFYDQSSLLC